MGPRANLRRGASMRSIRIPGSIPTRAATLLRLIRVTISFTPSDRTVKPRGSTVTHTGAVVSSHAQVQGPDRAPGRSHQAC